MYNFQKVRGFSWPSLASDTHAICIIFKQSKVFPLRVLHVTPTQYVSFSKGRGFSWPSLASDTHAICIIFKKSEVVPRRVWFLPPTRSVYFSRSPWVFLAVPVFFWHPRDLYHFPKARGFSWPCLFSFRKKGPPIFLEASDLWARCSRLFFSRKSLDFLTPCAKAAKKWI